MGMLVSPYRHAAGGGAVADFGALVRKNANQLEASASLALTWQVEQYDYNGWHDAASNTDRLTVIAGVSLVRVTSSASNASDDAIEHFKNGAAFVGAGRQDGEGYNNIVSSPIAVTAGDYLTTVVQPNSFANAVFANEYSWMSIEILPASTKYALVTKTATQTLGSGVNVALTFDSEVVDTDGFHDNVTNNTRLSVPVGGPSLVRLVGQTQANPSSGQLFLTMFKNGASFRGTPARDLDTSGTDRCNLVSPPLIVTPGTDYFEFIGFLTTGTTVAATPNTSFSIESVPSGWKYALVYKSAGTQSFTGGAAAVAVTYDAELVDTNNAHDNVTNNSRITVPAGCTRARPIFNIKTSNTAGTMTAQVYKNGAVYYGAPIYRSTTAGTDNLNAIGAWVEVTPGDYFELFFDCTTTCTIGTEDDNWFCVEFQ